MKINFLFVLLLTVICTEAQRRTTAKPDVNSSSTPKAVPRGRGRSRFVSTPEYLENNDVVKASSEIPSRRTSSSRRRQEDTPTIARTTSRTSELPRKSSYAVEEIINESPPDYFRKTAKSGKAKVLTDSNSEPAPFPSRKSSAVTPQSRFETSEVFESTETLVGNSIVPEDPVSSSSPNPEISEEQPLDTTLKTNTLDLPNENSPEEIKDFTKSVPQLPSTPKPTEATRSQRRNNVRSRTNSNGADGAASSRIPESPRTRARTRSSKKIDDGIIPNSVPVRTIERTPRRRTPSPNPAPAILNAEIQPDFRKSARKIEPLTVERSSVDLSASRTRDVRRRTATPASVTTSRSNEPQSRRSSTRTKVTNSVPVQNFPSRNSVNAREIPPIIDEQKLEVLPLFESEPKYVSVPARSRSRERGPKASETTNTASNRSPRSRSRTRNTLSVEDTFLTSATENDVKFTKPSENSSIVSVSVNVETRTESSFRRRQSNKKPQFKESVVISQVTEVTSKRTIPRRKNDSENSVLAKDRANREKNKIKEKITAFRGNRKSQVKLSEIKKVKGAGSDEIDESDNYPEPFKALIQAKKNQEGISTITESSRAAASTTISSTNVVTPPATTSSPVSTVSTKEINDDENELDPKRGRKQSLTKFSTRVPRTRSSSFLTKTIPSPARSTSSPTSFTRSIISPRSFPARKSTKVLRSTAVPPSTSPSPREDKTERIVKVNANLSSVGRGSYRKAIKEKSESKERLKNVDPILLSTKIPKPGFKKSERYNTKYRSDIAYRGAAARSTTNAPVYIPTIPSTPYVPTVPTVTTPTRTRVEPASGTKDADLGLEIISFDDPVNSIPSANLVNGELASTPENIILPLVKDGTTEKPVSIIERIIKSITAIQTTSTSELPKTSTVSTTESNSAILKLATKKSIKNDKIIVDSYTENTLDRTPTTEKPTTIIEKILSSLNAIQATDETNSIQVDQTTPESFEVNSLSLISSSTTTTTNTPRSMSSILNTTTVAMSSSTTSPTTAGTTTNPVLSTIASNTINTSLNPPTTEDSFTIPSISTEQILMTTESSTTIPVEAGVTMVISTITPSSPTSTQTQSSTLPTLSELLNGKTLEAFNNIVSNPNSVSSTTVNTDIQPRFQTLEVDKIDSTTTNTPSTSSLQATSPEAEPVPLSNDVRDETTTIGQSSTTGSESGLLITTSTTMTPATTQIPMLPIFTTAKAVTRTTEASTTTITPPTTTTSVTTTTARTTKAPSSTIVPRLTKSPTVTISPPSRTEVTTPLFLPSFLTTLFPSIFTPETVTNRVPKITTGSPSTRVYEPNELFVVASSTVVPTTVSAPRTTKTTTVPPTTTETTTIGRTTTVSTTPSTTTTIRTTTTPLSTTTTAATTTTPTTTPTTTTQTTTIPTTTTTPVTTTKFLTTSTQVTELETDLNTIAMETTSKKPKLKVLTEKQKKDLQTLADLEREQAALLQQLSFLTSLNFAGNNAKKTANIGSNPNSSNLANRVIQLAVERDQTKSKSRKSKTIVETTSTSAPEVTTTKKTRSVSTTTKLPNSIQDQLNAIESTRKPNENTPSIEDVLKQYNLNGLDIATTPKSSKYGKTNDAILASILKEQGIAPSTPKSLEGIFETTKRPRARTTQRPPGPLMQGLNWLLNVLAPQPTTTTRRPRKPKKPQKPQKPPVSEELLANSPTHITPVVTPAPKSQNALTQEDVQKLIKQLEGLQKDPSKGSLDLTQIKSLQTLINADEGVQVQANGEHGATSRRTTTERSTTSSTTKRKTRKSTTQPPIISVSNSVEDDVGEFAPTTKKAQAPIGFKPVPGVDDGQSDPFIRGNLLNAAVNVTRAISGFLGSALQDAAYQFTKMSSNGVNIVRNIFSGSTSLASSASASASSASKFSG